MPRHLAAVLLLLVSFEVSLVVAARDHQHGPRKRKLRHTEPEEPEVVDKTNVWVDEEGKELPSVELLEHRADKVIDYVEPGMRVLELGARYGVATCKIAKKTGTQGAVVAVEPDAAVWDALTTNVKANCPEAEVFEGAVSQAAPKDLPPSTELASFDALQREERVTFNAIWVDCQGCFSRVVRDFQDQILHGMVSRVIVEEEDSAQLEAGLEATLELNGFETVYRKGGTAVFQKSDVTQPDAPSLASWVAGGKKEHHHHHSGACSAATLSPVLLTLILAFVSRNWF